MPEQTGGEHVYDALRDAGVDLLVGLPGTQTLPLDRTVVERGEMAYVMARHETAIPHVAWGYHEAGGGVAATLTVPGPGDTNAMHGLKNAYNDCVPLLHVSADVDPGERGKSPIHEIAPDTFDNVVKANLNVERPRELRPVVERGIAAARTPPTGPVRLGVPSGFLAGEVDSPTAEATAASLTPDFDGAVTAAAELLADADRPLVYLGGGVRRSDGGREVAAELVDALDAPVVGSYKGKGVLDETRDEWLGTTASHLNAGAVAALDAADVVLALGTDFDGVTTAHWELPMGDRLVHVNLDPGAFDVAYDADVAVAGDAAAAGRGVLANLGGRGSGSWSGADVGRRVREEYRDHLADLGLLDRDASPAPTAAVLDALREELPPETVVVTDVGGFRLWSFQLFEARGPRRYVSAGSWAGMGVGLPGAIGARLAADDDTPVVCLTGDGGLLMCVHELHTAAEYDLDLVVVNFDNADYGTISKSPEIREYGGGRRFAWTPPDFPAVADAFGCRGHAAATASETAALVGETLDDPGTDLVTVDVDPDEPAVVDASDYDTDHSF